MNSRYVQTVDRLQGLPPAEHKQIVGEVAEKSTNIIVEQLVDDLAGQFRGMGRNTAREVLLAVALLLEGLR